MTFGPFLLFASVLVALAILMLPDVAAFAAILLWVYAVDRAATR